MKKKFVHGDIKTQPNVIYFAFISAVLFLVLFLQFIANISNVENTVNIKNLLSSLLTHMLKKGCNFVVLSYFFSYHSASKQFFLTSTPQQKQDTRLLCALCF